MTPLAAAGGSVGPLLLLRHAAPALWAALPGATLAPRADGAAAGAARAARSRRPAAAAPFSAASSAGAPPHGWSRWAWGAGALAAAAAAGATATAADAAVAKPPAAAAAAAPAPEAVPKGGKQLPEFTEEEVAQHRTKESRIWVTYRGGVYDITDFIPTHPGGMDKIMLAAGGSIEPFWGLYQQHQKGEIREILEGMRIGSLKGYDAGAAAAAVAVDHYANEPKRHPALVVRSHRPFNAETPLPLLAEHPVTPTDVFYVRHHLPVPVVDEAEFAVSIEGDGLRAVRLSVDDLRSRFRHATVTATIECAGNRRAEMKALRSPGGGAHAIKGLDWDAGAIGTAVWGGVRLRDVLLEAGLSPDDPSVSHVHFVGLDRDEGGTPYAASIPIHKALDPRCDEMNVVSAICEPLPGAEVSVHEGEVTVKGYAWSGGGRDVIRVDVSADGGASWVPAELLKPPTNASGRAWAKTLFRATVRIPAEIQREGKGRFEILCKATDESYNTQPESAAAIWNVRGLANNSWHRVPVTVTDE
ncbi:hypothetical protein Rsub_10166 [Raphidocelis subcapitata]|uniref:Cytochrome b5 heme-binding domain-containing protein n=1 Tax=Raphidocelis subcapitata TaxID=307507 RepID=A0A2V0PKK0_9CHLO|nr:hypothetical protein Rsub_10166 [Raphidocelis subcapitata]|eukprot:GBF97565.1 hypothetical protein Rsub_10166 [Raphidocelis subcapitata]